MSGALSLGVIGGVDGPTAVFVTGSPAPLVIYLLAINVLAFAVYGSTIGGMAAFGPLVGGWLATAVSWRWRMAW